MPQPDDATLAREHLERGPGVDPIADAAFWARFRDLYGWFQAATFVQDQHTQEWLTAHPAWNPGTDEAPPFHDHYVWLMAQYRHDVQLIADGLPR